MNTLVIDIGGSHVKCVATGHAPVRFTSGAEMTPERMVGKIGELTAGWLFEGISIGYPGVVRHGAIEREPANLGPGWVRFDFAAALGRPVKLVNDAAMQALGSYSGGSMLFLGLGTGFGSTLIIDDVVAPLELAHLPYGRKHSYEHLVGERGRKRAGNKRWRARVWEVVEDFRRALLPDYIVLGGGNAQRLKRLPPDTRVGGNACAFTGGFRMWEQKS